MNLPLATRWRMMAGSMIGIGGIGGGNDRRSDASASPTNEDEYLQVVGKTLEEIALKGARSSAITRVPRKQASDYLLSCDKDDYVHGGNLWRQPPSITRK